MTPLDWIAVAICVTSNIGRVIAVQKRWTAEELEYIRQHYGKMPTRELAAVLGRTPASVKSKANYIGIAYTKPAENVVRKFPPGIRNYLIGESL